MTSYGSESGGTPPGDQPSTPAPGPQPTQYSPPPGYMPPPGGMQTGVPGLAPARRRSPLLIIIGIVVGLLLLCGVGIALLIGGVLATTQPVVNAGDAYMTALRDGNYSKAFDLSASSLQ